MSFGVQVPSRIEGAWSIHHFFGVRVWIRSLLRGVSSKMSFFFDGVPLARVEAAGGEPGRVALEGLEFFGGVLGGVRSIIRPQD